MKNFFLKKKPLGCFLLMLLMLFCWTVEPLRAQDALKRLDWVCVSEPMPTVLKKLEQASGFKMLFTYNELQDFKVTINLKNQTIEKIVQEIISSYPLTYEISGKYISISTVKNDRKRQVVLKGQVTDLSGEPLPGASVEVKGDNLLTIGTVTDMDGNFYVTIPNFLASQKRTVVISFVGMKKEVIRLTDLNVMKPFKVGDYIVSVNGYDVEDTDSLIRLINKYVQEKEN